MNDLLKAAFRFYPFFQEVQKKCFIKNKNGKLYYNIGLVNHYVKRMGLFNLDDIIGGDSATGMMETRKKVNYLKFARYIPFSVKSEKHYASLYDVSKAKWQEFEIQYKKWMENNYWEYSIEELRKVFNERVSYGLNNMFLHTDATTASFTKTAILGWKLQKYGYDSRAILVEIISNINNIEIAGLNDMLEEIMRTIGEERKAEVFLCLAKESWRDYESFSNKYVSTEGIMEIINLLSDGKKEKSTFVIYNTAECGMNSIIEITLH